MSFAGLQAAWAGWLLEGLLAAGVRRVVVSPGSRSTPLVLAIAGAEAAGRIDVEVVVDERAAAFFALGQGRVTGEPSLLVCTSGTAGAHYLPAIVEAAESRIPLLALTADRPPELHGRGAAQTIDQPGMYAHFVRRTFQVGLAESDPRAVDGLLRTGMLAAHATRWPDPGPVHLNAAFRKPLEPDGAEHPELAPLSGRVLETMRSGLAAPDLPRAEVEDAVLDALADRLRRAKRGMIVLGPCTPWRAPTPVAVTALAKATGYPVLAEATSQHRFGPARYEAVVDVSEPVFGAAAFRERGAPDLVLQIGGAPTGRALGAWIASSAVQRIAIARHGVPEAFNQAARIVIGDLEQAVRGLADRLEGRGEPPADTAWVEAVTRVTGLARALAAGEADRPGSQGGAVRTAVEALPEGGLLVVGNSMPVRDVDLYVPASPLAVGVLSQRGAAGIDGLIAGAAGAAAVSGRPTLLLLGDVSFQHDVGGLAAAAVLETPLAIVPIRNGGGRLFDLLPVRGMPGLERTFERFFLTPPSVDVGAAARAFGVTAVTAGSGDELREALEAALDGPGASVVEAIVDADGADAVRRITSALDGRLAGSEGCFPP